jgi:DNA repair protein RadC
LTLKDYPEEQQPYNRLETSGAKSLTDAELLAIIIKSGTKSVKAIDIASQILTMSAEGLVGLHKFTVEELKSVKGIGRVKAIQLKALAELSIRLSSAKPIKRISVTSPSFVANMFMEEMRHLEQEHIKLIILNNKNHIIKDHTLTIGTVNASLVNPREVLIYCLRHQCVQFILMHNHPSGDPTPSNEDILMTKRMNKACELIGITLLDHIIIGNHRFVSLKEQGYINHDS